MVPIDAVGVLWQCAAKHASDFLSGNPFPELIMFAHHINFLRSICRWQIRLISMKGIIHTRSSKMKGDVNRERMLVMIMDILRSIPSMWYDRKQSLSKKRFSIERKCELLSLIYTEIRINLV